MTVLDTSVVVDIVLGSGAAAAGLKLMEADRAAAPDLLTFEVLAVLRRVAAGAEVDDGRWAGAVADLGDLRLDLFPSLPLRQRAWALRRNVTIGDALFVALAEALDEPLATKDVGLARAAEQFSRVPVIRL
jgi:predicted nucleic acid-binding protein